MYNFNEMFKKYTCKCHHQIKATTAPLKQHLGISSFAFARTEKDGSYCVIGDCPEIIEYYFAEKLYLKEPYCAHPDLVRSGILLFPVHHNLDYLEMQQKNLKIRHIFVIIQNLVDAVECFYFCTFLKDQFDPCNFLSNLDLLYKFTNHFKRESKIITNRAINEGYNIKKTKGSLFSRSHEIIPLLKF